MSLRYQINARILFSSLCILLLGGTLAVLQARKAVNKEVDSSINLAVQLIKLGFSQTGFNEADWLRGVNSLHETRHLHIQLQAASGQVLSLMQKSHAAAEQREQPPQWFIDLVGGKQTKTEQPVIAVGGKQYRLIIEANPLDEIAEVWQETLNFWVSFFLLTLLTFLAVHFAFNKALKSIEIIVTTLKAIETGRYQQKLPDFATREYDSIAKAINHMTGELNQAQRENRALTQHSLEIQEDERQRLAQELHDELGQSLTAIKIMAVAAARTGADIQQSTDSITAVCDHLLTVVRSMTHQLHPLVLTDLGLKAALEDLLNHWSARNPELKFSLNCDDEVDGLGQKMTIHLFRIIQECLTNIVRHANAKQAVLTLLIEHGSEQRLRLEVSDNGQGCVADNIKTGFGLLGMKERVNSLGGDFVINSRPQQGTRIIASIPL